MKIIIEYSSSWHNSFLTGSNDEPVRKNNVRKFKATSKSKEANDVRKISKNTVLGVLCRLIGDQRKLYQAQKDTNFYFKDMDISFDYIASESRNWSETVALINKSENRPAPGEFIGVIKDDEPLFFSQNSATLWSVLFYDFDDLLNFILQPTVKFKKTPISPRKVLSRAAYDISSMDNINSIRGIVFSIKDCKQKEVNETNEKEVDKLKKIIKRLENQMSKLENEKALLSIFNDAMSNDAFDEKIHKAITALNQYFPDEKYYESNGSVKPIRIYAGALYVMLKEMEKQNFDISGLVTKSGTIKGFSKRDYNGNRDFLNSLMGNKKKTTHTPYQLTKSDGQLEIILDIDKEKAKELKKMIENAGVSSFYLGKKGLAYVSDIKLS